MQNGWKSQNDFKFGVSIGLFPTVGAASMAVKELMQKSLWWRQCSVSVRYDSVIPLPHPLVLGPRQYLFGVRFIIIARFCIALFSALEQTHCTHVARDSQ